LLLGVPLAAVVSGTSYSVVVPLHNKEATVREAIKSALNQSKKPFEVIVVDDGSTDNSVKVVEEFGDKVTLMRNERNVGKAASINRAVSRVKTPYMLILDADTVLDQRFAHEAMRGFYSDNVVGVSVVVLPPRIKTSSQYSRLIEYLLGTSHKKTQVAMKGIWTMAGAAMMWKTDFLRKHQVPTDTLVEDMDLAWKTQATKSPENGERYGIGFSPKAISYTEEPKTFREYIKQTDRWFSIGKVLSKHARDVPVGLKGLLIWVLIEAALPVAWVTALTWLLVVGNFLSVGTALLLDLAILAAVSLHIGRKYGYPKGKVLKGVGWYWIYRFVNAFQFWRRIVKPKKKWY